MTLLRLTKRAALLAAGSALALSLAGGTALAAFGGGEPEPGDMKGTIDGEMSTDGGSGSMTGPFGGWSVEVDKDGSSGEYCPPEGMEPPDMPKPPEGVPEPIEPPAPGECMGSSFPPEGMDPPVEPPAMPEPPEGFDPKGSFAGEISPEGGSWEKSTPMGDWKVEAGEDGVSGEYCPPEGECVGGSFPPEGQEPPDFPQP